jgi:NTE family protein
MRIRLPTLLLAALLASGPALGQTAGPPAAPGEGTVALVLGGGGARGTAHVGVLRVLREAGVPIDMIVGTSMGALVGGLHAAGFEAEVLTDVVAEVDPTGAAELLIPPRGGLLDLQPLSILLDALLEGRKRNETEVPFYPVATDLRTGEPQSVSDGSLADAIRASTAIPVLFGPVRIGDRYYYDGGLKMTIPTSLARSLGASYVIAVDVTREAPYRPASVPANFSRIYVSIIEAFNRAELAATDLILDPGVRDHSYMDFELTADFVAAGERAARAELPRILADLEALGIPLRAPGDPHAGLPINEGWRDRVAAGRRAVAVRPRPWHLGFDLALAPTASGERVTPAPAPVGSRLRFGIDLRDGPLGRGWIGASYARSLTGGDDAAQLRAGYRLDPAWTVFAQAEVELAGDWDTRWGVRWQATRELALEAALRWPTWALEASAARRGDGWWLDVAATVGLEGWTRGHLEARAAVAPADARWASWSVHARAFAGAASVGTPATERFSVGPAIGLRGTPPDAWAAPAVGVASLEVARVLGDALDLLETARVTASAWVFMDVAAFGDGGAARVAWSLGAGTGLEGTAFGVLPFALGADVGYGFSTGTWTLGWRVGPRFPAPVRW